MTVLDQPADYNAEIREIKRLIRQSARRNPFESASITRGSGLRVALPLGIYLDGDGSIVANGLTLSAAQGGSLVAGGAYIRASGGGGVGAGGTGIGGDGNISSSGGTTRFNGGVAAAAGVSGTDGSFSNTLGARSAYVTDSVNVGGVYSRGGMTSESTITGTRVRGTQGVDTPWKGGQSNVEAIGNYVELLANTAQNAANAAQATANGRVTQAQLQSLAQQMNDVLAFAVRIAARVNEHQAYWEQAGKPNRPPLVQG